MNIRKVIIIAWLSAGAINLMMDNYVAAAFNIIVALLLTTRLD